MSEPALYRLMTWLSPGYPVGAFAYSHGLEWAIDDGRVRDAETLGGWIADLLHHGGAWTDAVIFAQAFNAEDGDAAALAAINAEVLALAPSAERLLETAAQGTAFLKTTAETWPWPDMEAVVKTLRPDAAYPVAVAVAARGHGLDMSHALAAYLHATAANLVSAGVRLIPLGQTEGQSVIARLEAEVGTVAARAQRVGRDDLGGFAVVSDIASMRHETQYTRLFRS